MKGISIAALALVASAFAVAPAQADYSDFLRITCGQTCKTPSSERMSSIRNWEALRVMGTTDYLGSSVDGTTIDPSALLAAARVVGAAELDRWLRTGGASSADVSVDILTALKAGAGHDVFKIIGNFKQSAAVEDRSDMEVASLVLPDIDLSAFMATLDGGGSGTAYCDQTIENAQNASAQQNVKSIMDAAYDEELGFSQVGGVSAGSNSHSAEGLFGGSCLDFFMTGDKDTLFRPPQLPQLMTMLTSMFQSGGEDGSGAGGCAGAPTVLQQVENSMPNAVFGAGSGGFDPFAQFGGFDGGGGEPSGNGIDASMFQTTGSTSKLIDIF